MSKCNGIIADLADALRRLIALIEIDGSEPNEMMGDELQTILTLDQYQDAKRSLERLKDA